MVDVRGGTGPGTRAAWRRFVRRWGWRAYALPVLTVVTIATLVQGATGSSPAAGHRAAAAVRPGRAPATSPTPTKAPVQVEGRTAGDADFAAGVAPPAAPAITTLDDDAVSCVDNTYRQLVLVSIRRQHLWACEGAKQVRSTPVTTGATVDDDQTPRGSWRVQAKQRDRYLVGPGYRDYVHYWMPFNGDFGLHDAPWQTMPFGSDQWRTRGSHGCVHLPTPEMAWMYKWAKVGSTVVTVEA